MNILTKIRQLLTKSSTTALEQPQIVRKITIKSVDPETHIIRLFTLAEVENLISKGIDPYDTTCAEVYKKCGLSVVIEEAFFTRTKYGDFPIELPENPRDRDAFLALLGKNKAL